MTQQNGSRDIQFPLKKGEPTQILYNELFFGPVFDPPDLEFTVEELRQAVDLEEHPAFPEGVALRLRQLGVPCQADDVKLISAELRKRYKARIGEPWPKTIHNWAMGGNTSTRNRENNYNICYALEMDLNQTAEFFMKYFQTVPFNYKDATDAVYFYCLLRGRPYPVIRRMLEESKTFGKTAAPTENTVEIARQICEIDDDEEFLRFLSAHCYNKEQQFARTRERITQLVTEIRAELDREAPKPVGMVDVHFALMGFDYQDKTGNKERQGDLLPADFARSLPTDQTLEKILDGNKTETYDTLRKTLIILLFYCRYSVPHKLCVELTSKQIREEFDDFYAQTNGVLAACGLAPLYEKNLFDRVMLFCAYSATPLDTFYGINDLRYQAD